MSRIGKLPVSVPKEVSVNISGRDITVTGPKGTLRQSIPDGIGVTVAGDHADVTAQGSSRTVNALHGLVRAELANAIHGVQTGWTKTLELSGVGYRATVNGTDLVLSLGFSHQITITPPPGIAFSVAEGKVLVSGIDKQAVGEAAAKVRAKKPPEPYKGKGIKYAGEYIRRKAGKAAKAVGGAGGAK